MSHKARRIAQPPDVPAYSWARAEMVADMPLPIAGGDAPGLTQADLEQMAREAFDRGFAEGRDVGASAEAERARAELARLLTSVDQLASARSEMIRATEHQMVELALAIARRIVLREISLDRDLLVAMAHVALQRLEHGAAVTVRFNPDDYNTTIAAQSARWAGMPVTVTPDGSVPRGGCRVESTFGRVDAGIDAQLQEVGLALLGAPVTEAEPGA